jgi:hypothetical protein
MHTMFWTSNLKERDFFEDLGVDAMVTITTDLEECATQRGK